MREDLEPRDVGGRLIYRIDVAERIKALTLSEIGSGDAISYSWDDGYERLTHSIKGGGSSEYQGVYHPEDGLCIGGGICIYCGRTLHV